MGARFAGSQRLGDRRRRRLAVETAELTVDTVRIGSLPAPPGTSRGIDGSHADHSVPALPFDRALSQFIPRQPWKCALGGLTALASTGFLLIAGQQADDWSVTAG